ncbi:hypothetical protein K501DRAFT_225308 [Backusella circina FSU 941]|nr:hypothetical protein K501DRAFT_225308 [Backusella circina FSU 941]
MRRSSARTATTTQTNRDAFDLTSVKRDAKEDVRLHERIFGLKEAPTFHPTKEEFKDPLAYIEKISAIGEKYGIIKIVPPKDYKPEFCLKTENFRFRTRIQKLNSMEGETRTNVNYLEQLTKYHLLNGNKSGVKIPQLDKRPIDLYKLKKQVDDRGGFQLVTKEKKWAEIGRSLGYTRKQCTSMSNALKSAYMKVVLPYEIWYSTHKQDVDNLIKKADNEDTMSVDSDICEVCQKTENDQDLLLCDGCNRGYHLYCLSPSLPNVPKSDWYCLQCLTAVGKDYGFEDGEEYSLTDFQKVCSKFKKNWFKKEEIPVTEEECEDEFWRLVENPHETCEVEYGADLHSTQHGSAFMSAEQMEKDRFDPWNLNVIPVAPQSLFTHIKTDISGMMVPWLYVGMCFSAFCWHNEDHYTYSINYMHWGETKTWYGVPGSDTAKFEETMRNAVPELFEQQPDLLFQLVTMLSPGRLLQEDVQVYAVDQRPGQFVVTYPKAYHSGFNHGFNFCEAVNFAPSKWLEHGLECVKRYKQYKRQPCFSHDELLITSALNLNTLSHEDLPWLVDGLFEMKRREFKEREHIRHQDIKEQVVELKEEAQCLHCHCYTYLSYISCQCTEKVSCLDHASELCGCDLNSKTLCTRLTDQEITEIVRKVKEDVGTNFEIWESKLNQIMFEPHVSPDMETLLELLERGEDTSVPQESLDRLRDYIQTVTGWNQQVDTALEQKDNEARQRLALDLLQKAYSVGFDERELKVAALKKYLDGMDELDNKKMVPASYHQSGRHLRTNSDKYKQLDQLNESHHWEDHLEQVLKKPFNQKNIKKLLREAKEHGIKGPLLDNLIQIEQMGKNWLYRIDQICKYKEKINYGEEQELLEAGINKQNPQLSIVFEPQLMNKLRDLIESSKQTYHELEHMLQVECKEPLLFDRPTVADAQRLVAASKEMIFQSDKLKILSHELGRISLWNVKARAIFMQGRQITKSLDTIIKETFSNVQSIVSGQDKNDLYCVCRKQEAGLMIECDHCHEWYHNSCVKVPRSVVKSSMVYFCPICTGVSDSVHHLTKKPKFDAISNLITTANALMFCPKEYQMLNASYQLMSEFKDRVQTFCRSRIQLTSGDIPHIRRYLQSLEGLEIDLMDETEFLKSKLQYLSPAHVNSDARELGIHELDRKDNNLNEPVIYHSGPTAIHESSYYSSGASHLLLPTKRHQMESSLQPKSQKVIKLTVKPPNQSTDFRHHS